jgi:hypothetical protein
MLSCDEAVADPFEAMFVRVSRKAQLEKEVQEAYGIIRRERKSAYTQRNFMQTV